ncbi:MAG: hypothetical protein EU549_04690, partial [Promethearchaeota archaeon]
MVDVEQFLTDCNMYNISFNPDFLEYINDRDDQCVKLKEIYNQFVEIIETDELNENGLDQLQQCLNDMQKVFILLKNMFETYKDEFMVLEELGKEIGQIFVKIEYMYGLDKIGDRIRDLLKRNFITLDLESLRNTIELLQKIIKFKDQNEDKFHFSDTALEIKHFCENLGSLDYEFLPYVLYWKLPPRLHRLYKSAKRTKKRVLI